MASESRNPAVESEARRREGAEAKEKSSVSCPECHQEKRSFKHLYWHLIDSHGFEDEQAFQATKTNCKLARAKTGSPVPLDGEEVPF